MTVAAHAGMVPRRRMSPPLGLSGGSAYRVWLISFTDIMGLMLTFFVLAYSMSERETQKFNEFAASFNQAKASFTAPPLDMGDSDTISLPRTRFERGLDATYLRQILDRKKLDVPAFQDADVTAGVNGDATLSIPIDRLMNADQMVTTRASRTVIAELVDLLSGTPNRLELQIGWYGKPEVALSRALAQGRVIAREMKTSGLNNDITITISAQALAAGTRPRLSLRFDPFVRQAGQ